MNRLWVRISLTFSAVIVIGISLFWLTTTLFIANGIPRALILDAVRRDGGLIETLIGYYRENGTLQGAQALVEEQNLRVPRGFTPNNITLVLADAAGVIVYGGFDDSVTDPPPLTTAEMQAAVSIVVNEQTIAYLTVRETTIPTNPNTAPPLFPTTSWTTGLLSIFLVGGVISILAGVIASRQLIRPLYQLAETARSFNSRNMAVRAVVRGTSEIRAVATAFNDMADEVQQAEQRRRGMLADVAHELRTPITVLQANLQAILDDIYPMNKEEIGALASQVDLLGRLVNDLHLLAQADARQLPMHVQPVVLNPLITDILDKFDAVAQGHEIALRADFVPGAVAIEADPVRMAQILTNLIQNAITHTPDGGRVTVTLREADGKAIVQVRDTGAGIPKDKQAFIFDRFYRIDPSRDRASGGAGLGLAIVKAIVKLHHGTIEVSSAGIPGLGTTFTVILPCQQPVKP